MSKELPGLDITKNFEGTADIYRWLPRINHPETWRPITTFIVGLYRVDKTYHPVEIDLKQRGPNNLFIVGGEKSGKERLMIGAVRRAALTIAPGNLKLGLIADENDPNKLLTDPAVKYHSIKPSTAFPEGPTAGKILKAVTEATISPDPSLLVIDNLGNFLKKTKTQHEKKEDLKTILNFSGKEPHLTVATINIKDLPVAGREGISPANTPGIWLFGSCEGSGIPSLEHIFPGTLVVYDQKKKNYSSGYVVPFDFSV